MFSAVRSQHRGVDICINNAGMARPDTLLSGSTSGWKDMFNVRLVELGREAGGGGGACQRRVDTRGLEGRGLLETGLQ